MADKSKFFRVVVEGATSDGRVVERADIDDMAATYNRETYGARVNMEHIRGYSAEPPFCAYGDVLACEARDVEIVLAGKTAKRRALFAQIDPTEELVKFNAKRQKIYTSVEIQPNFAGTGKAYLVGLAVTDSPASLGTEMLQFAAGQGDKSPLASRKQAPGNLFTAAEETVIELEPAALDAASTEHAGFFAAATDFFKKLTGAGVEDAAPPPPTPPSPPAPANDNDGRFTALVSGVDQLTKGVGALSKKMDTDLAAIRTEVGTVKASIANTDGSGARRPAASGVGTYTTTDC